MFSQCICSMLPRMRILFHAETFVNSHCPSSVVRHASCGVNNLPKMASPLTSPSLGHLARLGRSIGATCRSKIAKIVPIGNSRWPTRPPS